MIKKLYFPILVLRPLIILYLTYIYNDVHYCLFPSFFTRFLRTMKPDFKINPVKKPTNQRRPDNNLQPISYSSSCTTTYFPNVDSPPLEAAIILQWQDEKIQAKNSNSRYCHSLMSKIARNGLAVTHRYSSRLLAIVNCGSTINEDINDQISLFTLISTLLYTTLFK